MEVYAARRPDHSNCDVGNSMSTMCVGSGRIGEDGNGEEDGKFGYAPDKKTKHKKVEQNRRLLTKERENPTLNPKPWPATPRPQILNPNPWTGVGLRFNRSCTKPG